MIGVLAALIFIHKEKYGGWEELHHVVPTDAGASVKLFRAVRRTFMQHLTIP
ncbi:MAG: hypothetical protein M3Y72_03110 [Acidobacteriota bacterium]|nr:hypothetical protein [Acidobacteriota bacterium]